MAGLLPRAQAEVRKAQQVHPISSTDSGLGTQSSSGDLGNGPLTRRLTQWTIISEKAGVQNTKERLKSFWTTLGVVSALMAALTYPAVVTPMISKHSGGQESADVNDPLFITYVLLNTSSLILSFMVVIISVVLLAEVDLLVTDDDLETFIGRYQYLFLGLTGIFGTSIVTIVASIIVINFFNYNLGTGIASAVICMTGTVTVAVVALWIALWTRARLKIHIAEANALLRAAIARMRKMASTPTSNIPAGQGQGQKQGSNQRVSAAFQGATAAAVVPATATTTLCGDTSTAVESVDGNPRRTPAL